MKRELSLYGDGMGFKLNKEETPEKIWNEVEKLHGRIREKLPDVADHIMETEIFMETENTDTFPNCTCNIVVYICAENISIEREGIKVLPGTELFAEVKGYVMETLEEKLFPGK